MATQQQQPTESLEKQVNQLSNTIERVGEQTALLTEKLRTQQTNLTTEDILQQSYEEIIARLQAQMRELETVSEGSKDMQKVITQLKGVAGNQAELVRIQQDLNLKHEKLEREMSDNQRRLLEQMEAWQRSSSSSGATAAGEEAINLARAVTERAEEELARSRSEWERLMAQKTTEIDSLRRDVDKLLRSPDRDSRVTSSIAESAAAGVRDEIRRASSSQEHILMQMGAVLEDMARSTQRFREDFLRSQGELAESIKRIERQKQEERMPEVVSELKRLVENVARLTTQQQGPSSQSISDTERTALLSRVGELERQLSQQQQNDAILREIIDLRKSQETIATAFAQQQQQPPPGASSNHERAGDAVRRELREMMEQIRESAREQRREFNEYKGELQRSREAMQREEYAKLLEESKELKKILKEYDEFIRKQQPVLGGGKSSADLPVRVAPSDQKLIETLEQMMRELERQRAALEELKKKHDGVPPPITTVGPNNKVEEEQQHEYEYTRPRVSSKTLASRIREIAER